MTYYTDVSGCLNVEGRVLTSHPQPATVRAVQAEESIIKVPYTTFASFNALPKLLGVNMISDRIERPGIARLVLV
jgi:hypothetical protein